MGIDLNILDLVYAAIVALVLTWIVEFFLRSFRLMLGRTTVLEYRYCDFEQVMLRCCALFPKDAVSFQKRVYSRGMIVRVVTLEQKNLEGSLVGQNYDNMICLVTRRHVITHDLSNIKEIIVVD